jgi:hypothetical protein
MSILYLISMCYVIFFHFIGKKIPPYSLAVTVVILHSSSGKRLHSHIVDSSAFYTAVIADTLHNLQFGQSACNFRISQEIQ